ncbi:hypothetical protein LOK49_LG14G00956 [Camellia lanceoleosa]|uniref:Uncharacterized protein n=1 Tax=Camellia lanceoleosa TaxID=1840588 RepID=A0ACC0FBY8_9ERIC|nr:hypothetical protein LOK49_LG14G00956 [Camellia lanceoleosa]
MLSKVLLIEAPSECSPPLQLENQSIANRGGQGLDGGKSPEYKEYKETRAKLLLRGGYFDSSEELCRTCVSTNTRTLMLGHNHAQALASQETLANLLQEATRAAVLSVEEWEFLMPTIAKSARSRRKIGMVAIVVGNPVEQVLLTVDD